VARHQGHPFFTIGQRRGLGVALGEPAYVVGIDPESNTVTVGPRSWLDGRSLTAGGVVFSGAADLIDERRVIAQTRYGGAGAGALAVQSGEDALDVVFAEARPAPAPGQAVVVYDDEGCVLAGGWVRAAATWRA
jgi:tRNA-specific 2-thiouridylase